MNDIVAPHERVRSIKLALEKIKLSDPKGAGPTQIEFDFFHRARRAR